MSDITAPVGYAGDPHTLQQTLYELIEMAEESIVLQMYLFASDGHLSLVRPTGAAFPHAEVVAGWLLDRRRRDPDLTIAVLLDTNTPDDPRRVQGPGELVRHRLERAGVTVLNANLFRTRFDHASVFPPAKAFHRDWRAAGRADWVARQYRWQALHNVEDHRKNLVIDRGAWGAVTSHNLIDAAATWHENLLVVGAPAAGSLWRQVAEALAAALEIPQRITPAQRAAIVRLLARPPAAAAAPYRALPPAPELAGLAPAEVPFRRPLELHRAPVRVLAGTEVRPRIERALGRAGAGDQVLVASAYFSDFAVLAALEAAARRGARVRILVDDIAGLPLGRLAGLLVQQLVNRRFLDEARHRHTPGLEVRVHASDAGQLMHLKTVAVRGAHPCLIAGQANMTPNSFDGSWCETDLEIADRRLVDVFADHFEALWRLPASRPLAAPAALDGPRRLARRGLLGVFAALGIQP
ncbi:MAG TPA: phospholipase D-like domain-containing protein [Kofleriaceae bacterium]|nr:phospholipase D-like domain-containing protein [Kofleriaceae bacterium]